MKPVCSVEGCERSDRMAYGWCSMHYQRWARHGDPLNRGWADTETLFWQKVNKTDGCWLWTAYLNRTGYGQFRVNRRGVLAHRFAYELVVGPIPAGSWPYLQWVI